MPRRQGDQAAAGCFDLLGYDGLNFDHAPTARSTGMRPGTRPASERRLVVARAVPRPVDRRSQDHLGAEPPPALAGARPGGVAHRPDRHTATRSSVSSTAGCSRTRRCGASTGRACWSCRCRSPLVAVGVAPVRRAQPRGRARAAAAAARRPPWTRSDLLLGLDRQLSHVSSESLALLQPQHAPDRGGARPVRLRQRAARTAAPRRLGRRRARSAARAGSTGRSRATAGTRSARRTTTATRSTSICSRSRWRAPPAIACADRFADAARPACRRDAAVWRTTRGRLPHHRRRRWGHVVPDVRTRRRDDVRDRLASAAALLGRPELVVDAAHRRRPCGCLGEPAGMDYRAGAGSGLKRRPALASGRLAGHRLLRLAATRRRSPRDRRRPARIPQRRPRARRRALAHRHARGTSAVHRSRHRDLHDVRRNARSLPLHARCTTR